MGVRFRRIVEWAHHSEDPMVHALWKHYAKEREKIYEYLDENHQQYLDILALQKIRQNLLEEVDRLEQENAALKQMHSRQSESP